MGVGLLKFLLITILILWMLRIIIRLVFPLVLRNLFGKVQHQAENQAKKRNAKPEGSISIDYVPPQSRQGKSDRLGDFVDYEELK